MVSAISHHHNELVNDRRQCLHEMHEERFAEERHEWLGNGEGERAQAHPLTGG
ncbi:MAG: hypothetical protein V1656_00860 [Candidatus Jorgensenbacteria bacterium]